MLQPPDDLRVFHLRKPLAPLLFACCVLCIRTGLAASLFGSAIKLTIADGTTNAYFGQSVSVAGDVALIGASHEDDAGIDSGSAYVFERHAGGTNAWGLVTTLSASDGAAYDRFGTSVSMDGDVAVVGAYGDDDDGLQSGSAYVFERDAKSANAWGQVAKLTAADASADSWFGYSVAVHGDVAVVGAHQAADAQGFAYVFQRNVGGTNTWGQVAKLIASDGTASQFFGRAVAVAGDVAVIGAYGDDHAGTQSGAAYVFERNVGGTNAWGQVTKLVALDGTTNALFGYAVAVAGDAVVVGAYGDSDAGAQSGAAYVFERNAGGTNAWDQVARLSASDGAVLDKFGYSVSLDGNMAVIGAVWNDETATFGGSAYVFARNEGGSNAWGQVRKVTAWDGATNDEFGSSVAVAGNVAVIGARYADGVASNSGAAYLMPVSTETRAFRETRKLMPHDGSGSDAFGASLSCDGDVVLISAYMDDDLGASSGSAYIFERNAGGTNTWGEAVKLTASDGETNDNFGRSVSVAGDVALIGAHADDDLGNGSGSAYIFERNAGGTNAWGQVTKLIASDGATGDFFGMSVAVDGDVALIGASGDDESGDASGSAYVFERNAGGTNAWGQVTKLIASDGAAGDYFGHSVAVDGDVALIGAYGDDDLGDVSGSAYVFERNAGGTNAWGQVTRLIASDGAAGDQFGHSVAVDGDVAVVGAPNDPEEGFGSAYIFERNANGTNAWGQVAKLTPATGPTNDFFGGSVAVAGDTVLIGASAVDAVYMFQRNAGGSNAWGQIAELVAADDDVSMDLFGSSVAVAGDAAIVGASWDHSAYVFEEFFLPVPVLCDVHREGGDVVCAWTSSLPIDYTVQYRGVMTDGTAWVDLPGCVSMPGQDGTMSVTNLLSPTGQRYFRIRAASSPLR
ncbi:MAG: hypothetical protein JXB04_02565 [Kiritimatiellae bacterium]|nr:hypothetical protein [Kiritimatiellia bacterium]